MNYIVYKRYHGKTFSGEANLPYNTPLHCNGGVLYYNDKPICFATSQVAHQHFARNDDGHGLLRGELIAAIKKKLKNNHEAWKNVWEDKVCLKYKRDEFEDYWLWGHEFYEAPITDLRYIAEFVGVKV